MPNIEESKNKLAKIKKEIELFNDKIKDIIKQLNELIDTMNIYYKINNDLFNSYQIQNRSYQIPYSFRWNGHILNSCPIIFLNTIKHGIIASPP